MNTNTINILAFILLGPTLLFAQKERDSLKRVVIDPIIVTATNTEVLRSSVPASVTVINKEEIQQSGETSLLPIINKETPGVFITERGVLGYGVSNGAAGTISIRGTGGSPNTEVLVLTDGRPQMMGLMGHPLPDTYVSSNVERVEIVRGPVSILHGTNAMGGVINIISPKQLPEGLHGNLGGAYGTYNTGKIDGMLAYAGEAAGISVSADHYETDGQRDYSTFRITNAGTKAYYILSRSFKMTADYSLAKFKTYDPGTFSAPLKNNWVDISRGTSGFSLENETGAFRGALKAFYNYGIHDIYDGFHSEDQNIGFLLYQAYAYAPEGTLTAGIDYKQFGGTAKNKFANFGKHEITEYSGYFLLQHRFMNSVTASVGIRQNHNNLYGFETVPQLGLTWQANHQMLFRISTGKGFRSPTIRELYLFPAPTPTLQPERLWNYEAGLLYTVDQKTSIDITGYIARGSNLIRMIGFPPNAILNNSGAFTHNGVEAACKTELSHGIQLSANYSYLHPADQTMANPKHKIYIAGMYPVDMLRFSAGIQAISGLYGNDNYKSPLADYVILNARISAGITPRLRAYVSGENLTDRKYEIMAGYPMPGITILAGVNVEAF